MKKPAIFAGIGVLVCAAAAFGVAGIVKPIEQPSEWKSKRGTDAYYIGEEEVYELADINVNLKGADGQKYLSVGIGVSYKLGAELVEEHKAAAKEGGGGGHGGDKKGAGPPGPFDKAKLELKDRLTMLLSNKTQADIEGKEKKQILKQEILEEVQAAVFPDKKGRIENVYIKNLLIQ